MQALFQGRLDVSEDGCFGIATDAGVIPVVFPFGTTLIDAEQLEFAGTIWASGTEVGLGGGYANVSKLPAPCNAFDRVFLANEISEPLEE